LHDKDTTTDVPEQIIDLQQTVNISVRVMMVKGVATWIPWTIQNVVNGLIIVRADHASFMDVDIYIQLKRNINRKS